MKPKQRKEPVQAGFFNTWARLIEYFRESHEPEMNSKHGADSHHEGPAPEVCTYCEVIQDADQLGEFACIPQKQIECRGRNGYFMLAGASTGNILDEISHTYHMVRINLSSKSDYRDAAPVMIQGSHDAVERLLLYLLFEVGRERDKLQQQRRITHA